MEVNMGLKACTKALVYLSLLPNLESIRLIKIKLSRQEFEALVKHLEIHNKKLISLGLNAYSLALYHFELVLRELPQLVALHLQNTNLIYRDYPMPLRHYSPSVVTLKDFHFGKLKSLAIINGRKRTEADMVTLDLTGSVIEDLTLDYQYRFVMGDLTAASWSHVKKLEITRMPKVTLKCFGNKFQGVETLRVDTEHISLKCLKKGLVALPKLRFLKLYGVLNSDYSLFCPKDFSLKVTHPEVLFGARF
ncbi:hypothetical protein L0F63_006226 [Massospora cicadina]|nr:hypothetical protein L0F63_006226 [Massospora cicadina]